MKWFFSLCRVLFYGTFLDRTCKILCVTDTGKRLFPNLHFVLLEDEMGG